MISGLDLVADGRAFALTDLDRDGGVDVVVVNANAPLLQVLRNQIAAEQGYVVVKLEGGNTTAEVSSEWSARDGVGASISLRARGVRTIRELRVGEGLAAQNSHALIFGLGSENVADEVVVTWPSGRTQIAERVEAGSQVLFREIGEVLVSRYSATD